MKKLKIEFYKQSGKWYTTEEDIQVSDIHDTIQIHEVCEGLHKDMIAVVYIVEDDGHLQPFRFFNT